MKLLNIACGSRYHTDWVNIDFYANTTDIQKVNILSGLPFENNSFDAAYSSHFFEHLHKEDAKFVIKEAYRILKKDGILRIVVPDLENICREYIKSIDLYHQNEEDKQKHSWMTIELIDQMVRWDSGGEMKKYMKRYTLKKYTSGRIYFISSRRRYT